MSEIRAFENKDIGVYYTSQKLILSGDVIRFYEFTKSFPIGQRVIKTVRSNKNEKDEKPQDSSTENRARAYNRARGKITDIINSNIYAWTDERGRIFLPVFLTLTFAKNITDITHANYEFKKFIQRWNFELTDQKKAYLKYVTVIEFQKRGAVHYHSIIFNLPFMERIYDRLNKLWGNDYFNIKKIDNVYDIGAYVTKYMYKKFDDPRLNGRRCYFPSKGLAKPRVVYFEELIHPILNMIPQESIVSVRNNIEIPYLRSMNVITFNLKDYQEIRQQVIDFIERY